MVGRNKEVLFESGRVDAFNVCEWGAIKRTAVEGRECPAAILGFRESITAMGIVTRKDEPRPLSLNVKGVKLLRIVVRSTGLLTLGDHVDLVEACISK